MFKASVKVSATTVVIAMVAGTVILTALGYALSGSDGPASGGLLIAGSFVGGVYAFLITKWFLALPEEKRSKLNPRTRWEGDDTKRNTVLILVALVWAGLLVTTFLAAPPAIHPAIGALNVAAIWLGVLYWFAPVAADAQKTVGATEATGNDASSFDWMTYLFSEEAQRKAEGEKVTKMTTSRGTVAARDLPLDKMQEAWENEQQYLQEYKNSSNS